MSLKLWVLHKKNLNTIDYLGQLQFPLDQMGSDDRVSNLQCNLQAIIDL